MKIKKNRIAYWVTCILSVATMSHSIAEPMVFDGSSAQKAEDIDKLTGFHNLQGSDKGAIYMDNSQIVATGANLTIDMQSAMPQIAFVVGGYSKDSGASVNDNAVTIKSLNMQSGGLVVAGLNQITEYSAIANSTTITIPDGIMLSTNSNTLIIEENSDINTDIFFYGGNASTTLTTGDSNANGTAGYTDAYSNDSTLTASDNKIKSNNIAGNIYGGNASITLTTGNPIYAISSGSVSTSANAYNSILEASNNEIEGNRFIGDVYGGSASITLTTGDALNNVANADISESTLTASGNKIKGNNFIGNVYGGNASLTLTTGNTYSSSLVTPYTNAYANSSTLEASNNTIEGNGFTGNVYGGHISLDITTGVYTEPGKNGRGVIDISDIEVYAKGNTITLGEAFTTNTNIHTTGPSLYGGYLNQHYDNNDGEFAGNIKNIQTYDIFTDNKLIINAKQPFYVNTVANFNYYEFMINPAMRGSTDALLNASSIVFGTDATNKSNANGEVSKVSIKGIHSGNVLAAGDKFYLIHALDMSGNVSATNHQTLQQGISLIYDAQVIVDTTNNSVYVEILNCDNSGAACDQGSGNSGGNGNSGNGNSGNGNSGNGNSGNGNSGNGNSGNSNSGNSNSGNSNSGNSNGGPTVKPQLKALLEGRLAGAAVLNSSADRAMNEGLQSAIDSLNDQYSGVSAFGTTSWSSSRYNTGSHINVKGGTILAGIAIKSNNILLSAFIEGGKNDYNSYNNFLIDPLSVHGKGDIKYFGLGFLGKVSFNNQLYVDGMVRIGKAHTKFNTDDIKHSVTSESVKYKYTKSYINTGLRSGKIWNLTEQWKLDTSLAYLWSRQGAESLKITGDPFKFNSINSHRIRAMADFNYKLNNQFTITSGLGYEYELDGKAEGTVYHAYKIDAPSLKGGTGIASLGVSYQPTSNKALKIDGKLTGYAGKRRGGDVAFRLRYEF